MKLSKRVLGLAVTSKSNLQPFIVGALAVFAELPYGTPEFSNLLAAIPEGISCSYSCLPGGWFPMETPYPVANAALNSYLGCFIADVNCFLS